MKSMLKSPAVYQLYQELGGFFGARLVAIGDYMPIRPGARVIDIGCGPGHIVKHLPRDIDYVGFDVDEAGIEYARKHFGDLGQFHARLFDEAAAEQFGGADVVMMNGVMHHIPDAELSHTIGIIRSALKDGGALFTLDGCYAPGQSRLERWLLANDRGLFVREAEAYERLLHSQFDDVTMHVRKRISRLPYTFAIGVARKPH